MQPAPDKEEQDGYLRGYHDIPDDERLKKMSFVELSAELASCSNGSPKFIVIEREIKRHIARDQSEAARSNIFLGAGIAGFFTIFGAVLGGVLKTCPSCPQVTSGAVQQIEKALPLPASSSVNLTPAHNNMQSAKVPLDPAGQAGTQIAGRSAVQHAP